MTADDEAYRRGVLARSRNFLLAEALREEGWVLWLDADIVQVRPPCSSLHYWRVQRQCSAQLGSPGGLLHSPNAKGQCVNVICNTINLVVA